MTLPVLRKIRDLVAAGATVLGPKPRKTPSLAGYPDADTELEALTADVWGDLDGISRFQRVYGKGNVEAASAASKESTGKATWCGACRRRRCWPHCEFPRTSNAPARWTPPYRGSIAGPAVPTSTMWPTGRIASSIWRLASA